MMNDETRMKWAGVKYVETLRTVETLEYAIEMTDNPDVREVLESHRSLVIVKLMSFGIVQWGDAGQLLDGSHNPGWFLGSGSGRFIVTTPAWVYVDQDSKMFLVEHGTARPWDE